MYVIAKHLYKRRQQPTICESLCLVYILKLAILDYKGTSHSVLYAPKGTHKYTPFSVLSVNFLELFAADGVQPQIVVRGGAGVFNRFWAEFLSCPFLCCFDGETPCPEWTAERALYIQKVRVIYLIDSD